MCPPLARVVHARLPWACPFAPPFPLESVHEAQGAAAVCAVKVRLAASRAVQILLSARSGCYTARACVHELGWGVETVGHAGALAPPLGGDVGCSSPCTPPLLLPASLTGLYTLFVLDIVFRIVALYSAVSLLAHSKLPVTIFAFMSLALAAGLSLGGLRGCAAAPLPPPAPRHCLHVWPPSPQPTALGYSVLPVGPSPHRDATPARVGLQSECTAHLPLGFSHFSFCGGAPPPPSPHT